MANSDSADMKWEPDSKSISLPLTSEHLADVLPPSGSWEERYKKRRSIGRGGCAEVFEALDTRFNVSVALKVSDQSGEYLRRFKREVETLQKLQHPNVVEIIDAGDCWYTMPLAEGSLTRLAPDLGDDERIEAVTHAAMGLAAVHAAGHVHRDVSPNNILRIGDRWVVSDFGFVRKAPGMSSVPKTQGPLGTPGYMAPEARIWGSHKAEARSDVYSLGRTVAFITTATHPDHPEQLALVPPIWSRLVEKMTAEGIDSRFQTMAEVVAALEDVRRQLKEQRRAAWSAGPKTANALLPVERKVLGWIVHETHDSFRMNDVLKRVPNGERRQFNIGFMCLRDRQFLDDAVHEGEIWGFCLTDIARAWIRANTALLVDTPSPLAPEAPPDDSDDIPF